MRNHVDPIWINNPFIGNELKFSKTCVASDEHGKDTVSHNGVAISLLRSYILRSFLDLEFYRSLKLTFIAYSKKYALILGAIY